MPSQRCLLPVGLLGLPPVYIRMSAPLLDKSSLALVPLQDCEVGAQGVGYKHLGIRHAAFLLHPPIGAAAGLELAGAGAAAGQRGGCLCMC